MCLRNLICLIAVLAMTGVSTAADIANFDDLSLGPESYWNGSDGSGGFASGSAYFGNYYDDTWGEYWDSFAYSNITDTTTNGMAGQYNAIAGGGQGNSANYVVGFVGFAEPPTIVLDTAGIVGGLYVTNNNYAYYSMLEGDAFAKKFGGETGNDPDWLLLTITGKDTSGNVTGSVDFYLADYRFEDNCQDYIVNTWEFVDTSGLCMVKSLEFTLSSSDVGGWGMNTPAYFAVDTIVEEPTPLMRAVQNIEEAIESKIEAQEAISVALAKEREAIEALNTLLSSDELDGLRHRDIVKARQRICLAVTRERIAECALVDSVDKLEDALAIINIGSIGQQDWPEREEDDG